MIRSIDFIPIFWALVTIILNILGVSLVLWLSYLIAVLMPFLYFRDTDSKGLKLAMMAMVCIMYPIAIATYM